MSVHHIQEGRTPHAHHCKKLRTHMICKHSDSMMITTGTGMSVWKMEPPHQHLQPRYLQFINIDYTMFQQQNGV